MQPVLVTMADIPAQWRSVVGPGCLLTNGWACEDLGTRGGLYDAWAFLARQPGMSDPNRIPAVFTRAFSLVSSQTTRASLLLAAGMLFTPDSHAETSQSRAPELHIQSPTLESQMVGNHLCIKPFVLTESSMPCVTVYFHSAQIPTSQHQPIPKSCASQVIIAASSFRPCCGYQPGYPP